jgi:tellurite resistance protein TehA-like permease
MQGKFVKSLMGLIALALVLGFLAPPVLKLKDPAMTIVILFGVVAMVVSIVEFVRERND